MPVTTGLWAYPVAMTATDPYAARNAKPAVGADSMGELPYFLGRLRQLGATDEEVAGVAASWDDLEAADPANPEAWTLERRTEMVSASDADLVEMIDAARQEYALGTTTEGEQVATEVAAWRAKLRAQATEAVAGTVAEALEWVGNDRARAETAAEAEQAGRARVTLLRPLAELLAE